RTHRGRSAGRAYRPRTTTCRSRREDGQPREGSPVSGGATAYDRGTIEHPNDKDAVQRRSMTTHHECHPFVGIMIWHETGPCAAPWRGPGLEHIFGGDRFRRGYPRRLRPPRARCTHDAAHGATGHRLGPRSESVLVGGICQTAGVSAPTKPITASNEPPLPRAGPKCCFGLPAFGGFTFQDLVR